MNHGSHGGGKSGFFSSRINIVLIGFLAIAGYFLVTEHRAHLFAYWPWLLLLACPLLHVFMHRGHGGGGDDGDSSDGRQNPPPHRH